MINPNYGAFECFSRTVREVKVNVEAEIPTGDEVKKTISVQSTAFITKTEDKDGATVVCGKAVFCFVYLADDGYKKAEATQEFTAELPLASAKCYAYCIDTRAIGGQGGYTAKCVVKVVGEGDLRTENNALTGGDGLFIKEFTEDVDVNSGIKSGEFNLSDEFDVDYGVSEVLCYKTAVELTKVESGVSKLIFEGKVHLTLKVLPFSENNDILKECKEVPFRYELDFADALPDMKCYGEADVRKVSIKVFADEGKNKSTVSLELLLSVYGETFECEKVNFAEDVYSKTNTVELKKTETCIPVFAGQYFGSEKVMGEASGDAVDGGRIINVFGETLTLFGVKDTDSGATVDGTLYADVVFKNSDNGITVVPSEMPFSFDIACDGKIDGLRLNLYELKAVYKNGKTEFQAVINYSYKLIQCKTVEYVEEVTDTGERVNGSSAITLFVPKKGDGLWDISKELGLSEEEVTKLNPDLTYPFDGTERIVIYRQKT